MSAPKKRGRPRLSPRTELTADMRRCLERTATKHGVSVSLMISTSCRHQVQLARREWFYRMAITNGLAYSEISERTGFHHTSIMRACQAHSHEHYGTATDAPRDVIEAARPRRRKRVLA